MARSSKKALVAGGAGFIGSHLVDKLMSEGFEVSILDNLFNATKDNLKEHFASKNFHFIKGDVLNFELIKRLSRDMDVVFHEAAIGDVPFSIKDPVLVTKVNLKGTLNLLNACLDTDVKRFIYASSCSVYGNRKNSPQCEDMLLSPISPYAVTKLASEKYCSTFHEIYGLETVSLRFFNVYGSRQKPGPYSKVITAFVDRLLKEKPPVIYGDGEQTRDFVHVRDVVEAHMLAFKIKNAAGKSFNIGSGRSININRLAEILIRILDKTNLKPIHSDSGLGDIRFSCADISLAEKILGYKPTIDLEEGLEELVTWHRKNSPDE